MPYNHRALCVNTSETNRVPGCLSCSSLGFNLILERLSHDRIRQVHRSHPLLVWGGIALIFLLARYVRTDFGTHVSSATSTCGQSRVYAVIVASAQVAVVIWAGTLIAIGLGAQLTDTVGRVLIWVLSLSLACFSTSLVLMLLGVIRQNWRKGTAS